MLIPFLLLLNIFTFNSCVIPVDYEKFLRDGDVSEIILNTKTGKVIVDVEFNREDLCPKLLSNNGDVIAEGGFLTIHKSAEPKSAVITIANSEIYTEIYWFYNSVQIADTDAFTASTENPPFLNAKTYLITVIGITNDEKAYGTTFNIQVAA